MKIHQKEKGFTIIEVVLVLAIAGLIFLMVFIALPALQRSQRDTQRKNDLSRLTSALTSYTSNNRGSLPDPTSTFVVGDWTSFESHYLTSSGDKFTDPSGTDYTFKEGPADSTAKFDASSPNIYVTNGAVCNGESTQAGAVRNVAFQMVLEGNGVACQNN